MSRLHFLLRGVLFVLLFAAARPALAQEEAPEGWFSVAELTAVWTGGNAKSNTLGLAGSVRRAWARSELKLDVAGIRTESALTTERAVGASEADFELVRETRWEKTAESYYARSRFDYRVSDRFLLFGGLDWLRNTFSGIDSRTLLAAGAGNTWLDDERARLKTDYGVTYTFQDDVVNNPFIASSFPGVRAAYDYARKLTASTDFASVLVADWNLDDTDDLRVEMVNSLPVAISSKLALKPSLRLLWRNAPSLREVALFSPGGADTGQTIRVPLRKLDTFFTLALVVKI